MAINIIQNAIENSYHGKIDIHISYDWNMQRIIFIVNDEGIGMNQKDQETIFKVLSD